MAVVRRLRVLVVDDQPAVREVVGDMVQFTGHDVIGGAADGIEAVEQARRLRPDIVIMDVVMPRANGIEAMRTILAEKTAIGVLLMSGEYHSHGMTKEELLKAGAAAFLEKPFSLNDLTVSLEKCVGGPVA
ncbi:MAG: response regulator [Verrucomicrobiia bacterium]